MTDSDKSQEQELIPLVLNGELGALVLELWQQTRMDWGFATDRLASVFRRERALGSSERRLVAELLYTMIRHLRRIDLALELGGLRVVGRAPDRKRLLACLILEYGLKPAEAARQDKDLDWNKVANVDETIAAIRKPVERIAVRHSLPDFLAQAFVSDLGVDKAEALSAALNQRAPMSIRCNTLKTTRDALIDALAKENIEAVPGQLGAQTLQVVTRTNLFGLDSFHKGFFEAQDEGSQLIAELVAPPPKGIVVDYCAGAGGKSLALAAIMENRGRLMASDIDSRKLKELRRRAKRAGAGNIQAVELVNEAGAAMPKPFETLFEKASRVLVDAPCTGVGALRRNPEARWRLSESDLARFPPLQLQIAERALDLVAPGGRLIYATCSLLRAENEAVVEQLLASRPDLEILSPIEVWGRARGAALVDPSERFLWTAPHLHGTDGFFAAVLRRKT